MLQRRVGSIAIFYALFAFLLLLTHQKYFSLPFFWDEAGQFVAQARDIYEGHGLLPHSVAPNSHPPGLPLMLAAVWKVAGDSIAVTRISMLLMGAAFLTASFLLAVELLRGSRGAPAFFAIAMLALNPLVFTQSMMAQLDLPSALFTTLLLLGHVMGVEWLAIGAAALAVAFKETSIAIPLVLAWFAWRDGRRMYAAGLAIAPVLVVANWVGYVTIATGRLFGDSAYTEYNMFYPLHPLRLGYAMLRRISYLGIENLHIVPCAILIWRWRQIGFGPLWGPVALACVAHTVLVSVTGGAVLERYLLPVLPVLYIAYAGALSTLEPRWRNVSLGLVCAGLLAMLFVRPPWPYALENNLAMTDFVESQRNAAELIESRMPGARITTAWPLTDALRRPYLGYVAQPLPNVRGIEDLSIGRIRDLEWRSGDVLVIYNRAWNPARSLARVPWVQRMLVEYFRAPQEATIEDMRQLPRFLPLIGLEHKGFWVEILVAR